MSDRGTRDKGTRDGAMREAAMRDAGRSPSTEASAPTPFRTPYPSYRVLDKWDTPSFNEATRRVLADRLRNVPSRRFLDPATYATLRALVDTILPQPERPQAERVPVEAFLDAMLYADAGNGTRYADALAPRAAWRRGLAGIEQEAIRRHGCGFAALGPTERAALLRRIDDGDVDPAAWQDMKPRRFFRSMLLNEAVKVYYAHPYAMDEIGFGGPASPRGYVRLGPNEADPWEAPLSLAPQPVQRLD
ncbi:MAG: gluconate 2-dehydrogenase subunit 3 family protein [Lautropia sp.]